MWCEAYLLHVWQNLLHDFVCTQNILFSVLSLSSHWYVKCRVSQLTFSFIFFFVNVELSTVYHQKLKQPFKSCIQNVEARCKLVWDCYCNCRSHHLCIEARLIPDIPNLIFLIPVERYHTTKSTQEEGNHRPAQTHNATGVQSCNQRPR